MLAYMHEQVHRNVVGQFSQRLGALQGGGLGAPDATSINLLGGAAGTSVAPFPQNTAGGFGTYSSLLGVVCVLLHALKYFQWHLAGSLGTIFGIFTAGCADGTFSHAKLRYGMLRCAHCMECATHLPTPFGEHHDRICTSCSEERC